MNSYNLTKEELISFAQNIYEEANYGYLDLKESFCDKMVVELLKNKQPNINELTTLRNSYATVTDGSYTSVTGASNSGFQFITSSGNTITLRDTI